MDGGVHAIAGVETCLGSADDYHTCGIHARTKGQALPASRNACQCESVPAGRARYATADLISSVAGLLERFRQGESALNVGRPSPLSRAHLAF